MSSPACDDSDQAGTTPTPSADEHSLAVVRSGSDRPEVALKRGWPESDALLDERVPRRDAEWHERLDSVTQDIDRLMAQHERMMARHERMLQNLAPLIPWARAVFVRQRYELSQDFILCECTPLHPRSAMRALTLRFTAYPVWLRQELPQHVTQGVHGAFRSLPLHLSLVLDDTLEQIVICLTSSRRSMSRSATRSTSTLESSPSPLSPASSSTTSPTSCAWALTTHITLQQNTTSSTLPHP